MKLSALKNNLRTISFEIFFSLSRQRPTRKIVDPNVVVENVVVEKCRFLKSTWFILFFIFRSAINAETIFTHFRANTKAAIAALLFQVLCLSLSLFLSPDHTHARSHTRAHTHTHTEHLYLFRTQTPLVCVSCKQQKSTGS